MIQDDTSSISDQLSFDTNSSTEDNSKRKRLATRPRLVIDNVYPDGTVECQLLSKQKTISFKFNHVTTRPTDIVNGMIQQELLKEGSYPNLTDSLQEIIEQLKVDSNKIPEFAKRKVRKNTSIGIGKC